MEENNNYALFVENGLVKNYRKIKTTEKDKSFAEEVIDSFASFIKNEHIQKYPLLITGTINNDQSLEKKLFSFNEKIITHCLHITDTEILPFATSIGLALDAGAQDHLTLQFRQKEFVSLKELQHKRNFILKCSVFSLILSGLLYLGGNSFLEKKSDALKTSLYALEQIEGCQQNYPSTSEEMLNQIDLLNKKISREKKQNLAFFYTPKVSHILHLFNNLSCIKDKEHFFEILDLDYTLTEYPTITNESKPYTAEAIVKIKIKDDLLSEKLQNELAERTDFLTKLKWKKEDKNIYTASFQLQPKPRQ